MIDPANKLYGSYVTNNNVWLGFDNIASQTAKVEYAVDNNMAGVMFWSCPGDISTSTVRQGQSDAADYPALSLIHNLALKVEQLAPP